MNRPGKNEPGLVLQQQQGLALTPTLKQSLHILTLPILELATYIRAQAEENPALELTEFERDEEAPPAEEQVLTYDEAAYEESWQSLVAESSYEPYLSAAAPAVNQQQFSATLPAAAERDLQASLRLQLALKQAPVPLKNTALAIIEHLDDDGYFSLAPSVLAAQLHCGEELVLAALTLVQSLEPAGVAARDLSECLRLQISADEPLRELTLKVIAAHLPELAANRPRETARALKTSPAQIEQVFARIRALNPRPGAAFSGDAAKPQYIVPDIIVREQDGAYQVILNDNLLPRLSISLYFRRSGPLWAGDAQTRDYLRQALANAQNLLRNIEKRRQTLYRLANLTVERQSGFLRQGLGGLAPLTMRQAAEQLELHESTISRAIAGKYIQTPRGVYEWKFFFPRAFDTASGALAPAWAKAQLKELIAAEDKTRPLSDQQLSAILAARGATLARRTVAKYREELGIAPKHLRRKL